MTVFVKEEEELFRRFTETHYQRGYTAEQITGLLMKAGLTLVEISDADTNGPIRAQSERVLVVAKEQGKKEK